MIKEVRHAVFNVLGQIPVADRCAPAQWTVDVSPKTFSEIESEDAAIRAAIPATKNNPPIHDLCGLKLQAVEGVPDNQVRVTRDGKEVRTVEMPRL